MPRCFALIMLALLLSACQTSRVTQDFDATRDFASYHTWNWAEPGVQYQPDDPRIKSDLTDQRIRQAVTQQMEQRGLRQAPAGQHADLTVKTWLIIDTRQQQVTVNYGPAPLGYWGGYWGGPGFNETRNLDYKVATLQIDLLDGHDSKLVWRASAEQLASSAQDSPQDRTRAIDDSVAKLLSVYPPH